MDRPIKREYHFYAYEYDTVTQQNAENSLLLRLPTEIRNTIYGYCFDAATLEPDLSPTSAGRYRIVLHSSRLLRVCRQIRFEARPFQTGITYSRLDIRMQSKHISDLVDWVGASQCAEIVEIGMFQSLAGAIFRQVRNITELGQGQYTGPWSASRACIFPALKRVVVTYATYLNEDAYDVETSLQMLFGNVDLEVEFRAAVYWG
ncbi:hypothetical protein E8E11_001655 [Didymella keratinophila]|nr:hypothetical protein E8E11_001655 [Didymella keratinophila]